MCVCVCVFVFFCFGCVGGGRGAVWQVELGGEDKGRAQTLILAFYVRSRNLLAIDA